LNMKFKANNWFWVSLTTLVISLAIPIIWRPSLGIDFTGGSLLEIKLPVGKAPHEAVALVREKISEEFSLTATVQATQEESLIIRMPAINQAQHQEVTEFLQAQGLFVEELRFESIGPTIGEELRRKSIMATVIAIVVVTLYLTYTFRKSASGIRPWQFGVAASYALVHDVAVVVALYTILGRFWQVPIDSLFVTAMLAIGGYSVNDTVVIFNRFQQEWQAFRHVGAYQIMQRAINLSLARSLYTSLTTLLVLLALIIFGGSTIRWFVLALAAGTVVGTYSSLLVAPPFLMAMARQKP
jgi:preprotein translocase subunit SecF